MCVGVLMLCLSHVWMSQERLLFFFFFIVGSGDSIQIIRLLWQKLLPAEPSNWPRILLSGHINTAYVSTQICKIDQRLYFTYY